MTVILANDVPPAIQGNLKRWFIEPRPNVFVGTLNSRTYHKVMEFINRNAPEEFGYMVIATAPNCQGYTLERYGPQGASGKNYQNFSGIPLIQEQIRS